MNFSFFFFNDAADVQTMQEAQDLQMFPVMYNLPQGAFLIGSIL